MPGTHGVGCGCRHEEELLGKESLLPYIDIDAIQAFNEKVTGSAKTIFKSYDNRLNETKFCDSEDGDPELMITVPFISPCKITSFHLIGGDNQMHPTRVKLTTNKENLDFSSIQNSIPLQEVQLVQDFHGTIEYPLNTRKFSNTSSLTFYFDQNEGADSTRLYYIGIRGEGSNFKRAAVTAVYEASPNVKDNEVKDEFIPQVGL